MGVIFLFAGGNKWIIPPFILFVGGSLETHYKRQKKNRLGVEQGGRTWKNIGANGGAATIFALSYIPTGDPKFLFDFFRKEPKRDASVGTAGAVTIQGFLFALMGSTMISALLIFYGYAMGIFIICLLAGFVGCVIDSLLGSTLEQNGLINIHEINLMATLIGGFLAMITSVFLF